MSCHDLTLFLFLMVVENSLVTSGKGDLISTKRVSGTTVIRKCHKSLTTKLLEGVILVGCQAS